MNKLKNLKLHPIYIVLILVLFLPFLIAVFFNKQTIQLNAQVATTDAEVTIDRNTTEMVSDFNVGVTHMQYSLDPWGDPASVQRGKDLVRVGVKYQNQHIVGFGADDINPSPGVYNWASLDARIQTARDSGNEPVITLCCAPGWMKASGSTWQDIAEAPTAAHHQDYANLSAEVAKRYPDVKYFQVWNEMKGMWNDSLNRWDYEKYTDLYNKIWTSVKAVRPDAKLGGPYISLAGGVVQPSQYDNPIPAKEQAVVDYWMTNKLGADFIVADGWVALYHEEGDWTQDPNITSLGWNEAELLNRTAWFAAVTKKLKSYDLPVWWAEDYFVYSANDDFEAIGLASILYHELKGGASTSLRWKPQATGSNHLNLFTDTRNSGGGQPFSNYAVYKDFHSYFGPGTQILQSTSSDPKILVLASAAKTLIINQHNVSKTIAVNGLATTVDGYKWVVINTPDTTLPPQVTSTPIPATPTLLPTVAPTNIPIPTMLPTSTPTPTITELLLNGSFDTGTTPWSLKVISPVRATYTRVTDTKVHGDYAAKLSITRSSARSWDAQLRQDNLSLIAGKTYTISFWAKASKARSIDYGLQMQNSPYSTISEKTINLTTAWTKYTHTYTPTSSYDQTIFLRFNLAKTTSTVWLDNVSVSSN